MDAAALVRPSGSHFWAVHGRAGAREDHGVAETGRTRPLDYRGGPGQSVVTWTGSLARLGRPPGAREKIQSNFALCGALALHGDVLR